MWSVEYEPQAQKLTLVILDMLRQFLRYTSLADKDSSEYTSLLFDQEKAIIQNRVLTYLIQTV